MYATILSEFFLLQLACLCRLDSTKAFWRGGQDGIQSFSNQHGPCPIHIGLCSENMIHICGLLNHRPLICTRVPILYPEVILRTEISFAKRFLCAWMTKPLPSLRVYPYFATTMSSYRYTSPLEPCTGSDDNRSVHTKHHSYQL